MRQYACISIALAITLLSACGKNQQSDGKENQQEDASLIEVSKEQFDAMQMEVSPLRKIKFDEAIKASGIIDVPPENRAKVTSYVGGYIKNISLLVGDKVVKGSPLLTLESPEYIDLQRDYLEIAGQMNYFKAEYERQETLFNEKIASRKKYLEAESEYKKAKAQYESLQQKLKMLRIDPSSVEKGEFAHTVTVYAPISGDITNINASIGMSVSPSDIILEIVDNHSLHLELSVFEKDIFQIKKGQKIKFTIPQVNTEIFEAEVTVIGTSVQGNNRVIPVYASPNEPAKHKLLTGMFIEANLITTSRDALSVPFDAVVKEESNHFLLIFESEKDGIYHFRKTPIKIGSRNGDDIEIIPDNHFTPTTKVLIKGVYDII